MEPTKTLTFKNSEQTTLTLEYFEQHKQIVITVQDLDCYPEEQDGAMVLDQGEATRVLDFFAQTIKGIKGCRVCLGTCPHCKGDVMDEPEYDETGGQAGWARNEGEQE